MAKKSKKSTCSTCNQAPVIRQALQTRVVSLTTLRRQPGALHNLFNTERLNYVEDLRTAPEAVRQQRQYKRIDGAPADYGYRPAARLSLQNRVLRLQPFMRLQFHLPEKTLVCVRRKTRRRVLFALRQAGKSGRSHRTPRWSAKSHISCK